MNEFIWSYANILEKMFHKSPSGCDVTTAMKGGALKYKTGVPPMLT